MKKAIRFLAAALAPLFLLCGCEEVISSSSAASADSAAASSAAAESSAESLPVSKSTGTGKTAVWFFDVGQGDSELVQLPNGKNLLIDAGTAECGTGLVKLIKGLGVQELDYVVATHPHADHIGSMRKIIETFAIGSYYMPRVADDEVPTTSTYTNLLKAMQKKGIKAIQAKAGVTLFSENGCKAQLLAPVSTSYKNLNNYSAVTLLTIGKKKFLFTGDAEKESEQQMLKSGASLQADVLKCGHHGSKTSTTASFLKAVSPTDAVISCGRNNDYGFPPQQTLSKLNKDHVKIYRTDEQHTICARTDGNTITFQTGFASATAA